MKEEELRRLFELEKTYWWFVGTRHVIERALRRALAGRTGLRLLDVGSGSGIMLDRLRDLGRTVGFDISWEAARFCRNKGHGEMVVGTAEALPFAGESFDAVVAADVLEHLPDEDQVLGELRRVLRPGGVLLLSVPAFMLLWSHHDVAIGHRRRYRRGALLEVLRQSEFRPLGASYFNFFLFPPFVLARLGQRLFRSSRRAPRADYPRIPGPGNRFFIALLTLEARLLARVSFPWGTSIMALARRE